MTVYSYAQLEGLWIAAGGAKSMAPLMAAIAEAESGGNSDAENPSGATGLWQILGNPFPGNAFDPATNAKMAVDKYKTQGLKAWATYTNGAYKAYLSSKTTPDTNVPGSPTSQQALTQQAQGADCLLGGESILGLGLPCLFSKSNARAFLGAWIMSVGGILGLAAVALLAAGPLGGAAEKAGGALMLVPGAEAVGAGVAGVGRAAKNPSGAGRSAARRRAKADDEEFAARKKAAGGEPRENPEMFPRGGAARESDSQRAARRRREQAAARARARRAAGSGKPASREEAGF